MTPLLAGTLAYAAGLLAGLRWPPSVMPAAAWSLAAALVLVVAVVAGRARVDATRVVIATFALAGVLVGGTRAHALRDDCRARLADGAGLVITGVPRALPLEGTAVVFAARRVVQPGEDGSGCRGSMRVRAPARHLATLDSAARGLVPDVTLRARWLSYPAHDGWPRPAQYAGVAVVDSVLPLRSGAGTGTLDAFRVAQQARLRTLLPERWPLAEALLLAQKSGLAPETRSRWVAAGLVHLLAISGMHVGLITAGVLALCTLAGLPQRRARRVALLLTAAYVLFLGAPTAALRALLQASLLFMALELQRPSDAFTLLAAAALAIMLLDPMALLDPGFQLSFAGMAGLIAWRRPVAELLPRGVPRYLRDGIAAGIAASALTTPIAALHFGQAAWVGIPGSLVAVPILAAAVGGLFVTLLAAALAGPAATPLAPLADLPLRLLDATAALCAAVPGGHGYVAAPTVLACLAAAAAAIVLHALLRGSRAGSPPPPSHASAAEHEQFARRRRTATIRLVAAGSGVIVVIAWAPLFGTRHGDDLVIHAIDVGQGDAFAIRTPRNRWILVDAGPRTPRTDAGRDRVVPFLLRNGARRVDVLILTHPDADHIGGAAAVLEAFDVGVVVDPGLAAGKDMFIDLLATARRAGQRWVAGREGISFDIDGVSVAVLYPFAHVDADAVANDNSVVFRLVFGEFAALFTGDAPESVEDLLVERHGARLAARLLKVGHHGSTTSTGESLLATIGAQVAVVSAGRRNRYGHPAPAVLERLRRHDVAILRTDQLGNVTIRASRAGNLQVLAR
jgi:competence protein ComEC